MCRGQLHPPHWGKLSSAGIRMAWMKKGDTMRQRTRPTQLPGDREQQEIMMNGGQCRGVISGWGCKPDPVLPYFYPLSLRWCLATLGWVLGVKQQSPGDTGESSKRYKGSRSRGMEVQASLCDTSRPPAPKAPLLGPRSLLIS